jgi:hypothetical protein
MTTPDAPDPRKVAEAALDMFVYAPMGLALEAKELLPKLAERGRNQVVLARLGARFAMQRAEAEVDKLLERIQPHEAPFTGPAPAPPFTEPPTATEPVPEPAMGAGRDTADMVTAPKPQAKAPKSPPATGSARKPAAPRARTAKHSAPAKAPTVLAIPGYDTLSASQVVPRLDALRANELEAIRRHEVANRGRRTILSRIAQLQG